MFVPAFEYRVFAKSDFQSLTRFGWKSIGRVRLDIDVFNTSDSATQDGPHLSLLDCPMLATVSSQLTARQQQIGVAFSVRYRQGEDNINQKENAIAHLTFSQVL